MILELDDTLEPANIIKQASLIAKSIEEDMKSSRNRIRPMKN